VEQQKTIVLRDEKVDITELEVQAIVEKELKPFREAINPASAPYLTVAHALWAVGLMVTILMTVFGYLWSSVRTNAKEIESREDKLRSEFNAKNKILDERIWQIGLRTPISVDDIIPKEYTEEDTNEV
jgi:hypothetical protein